LRGKARRWWGVLNTKTIHWIAIHSASVISHTHTHTHTWTEEIVGGRWGDGSSGFAGLFVSSSEADDLLRGRCLIECSLVQAMNVV